MINGLYFPPLKRRAVVDYLHKQKKFYAKYGDNYKKIEEDCQERCVYCDVTRIENGGDVFSIDHFRPKSVFLDKFKIIEIHPYNLYISCQKCNVLKSDDWYTETNSISGISYKGKFGYIDRFRHDIKQYMHVNRGVIIPLKDPAEFMIKKMQLNRTNRIYLRSKRELSLKKKQAEVLLNTRLKETLEDYANGVINADELASKVTGFTYIQGQLLSVID